MMQTPLQTFLVLWTDLWLQGQWAQRWGGMMCTSPRRYPAGMPHHFISLLGWREGTCPAPHYSVSGKRRNTPPGRWIKRASAAEAGADGPAGRAHPCDHILLSWSVASWSSFSETSQLIRGSLLVCIPAASPGGRVFHQPGQILKPVLRTSSTVLFLQSCDSKEPKRLTEPGS